MYGMTTEDASVGRGGVPSSLGVVEVESSSATLSDDNRGDVLMLSERRRRPERPLPFFAMGFATKDGGDVRGSQYNLAMAKGIMAVGPRGCGEGAVVASMWSLFS